MKHSYCLLFKESGASAGGVRAGGVNGSLLWVHVFDITMF